MNAGVWVSKRGLRRRMDRHKKGQLSYFQIGWLPSPGGWTPWD